jgi:hypothetical protein
MNKYDDIINLPHHTSRYYPRMTLEQRSAQFAPFDALEGYSDGVRETEVQALTQHGAFLILLCTANMFFKHINHLQTVTACVFGQIINLSFCVLPITDRRNTGVNN